MSSRDRRARLIAGVTLLLIAVAIGVLVTRLAAPLLDISLLRSAEGWRDGVIGHVMRWASDVGYSRWLVPATLVLALGIGTGLRGWHDELLVASATVLAALTARLLKQVFERARPSSNPEFLASGFSMPSGHAAASSAFSASLFIVVGRLPLIPRRVLRFMLVAFALIVGTSRVVLGVHYPTDVVAGVCVGIGVTLVLDALLPRRAEAGS